MKSIKHYISTVVHHPTKVIWKLDKIFLRGNLKKLRNAQKEKKRLAEEQYRLAHPEEWYDKVSEANRHCFPIIGKQVYSVKDLVLSQFIDGQCVFYDIAVRLLAVDEYYGKNDFGYELYRKMQYISGFDWIPRFQKLILSYDRNGFQDDKPIEVDDKLTLMDGAHRLTLAIYNNIELLPAVIYQTSHERCWNYNWFWEMNYTHKEINLIHQKAIDLFNYCKYNYVGVIWPPAFHVRNEIINEINTYLQVGKYPPLQNADCQVVRYYDVCLNKLDFAGFLRAMYYMDVMDEEGIKWKLQSMANSLPEGCEDYNVRIFYLDLSNPDISRNLKNDTAQSRQIARIKKAIRSRFEGKVNNYEYDNIMHISDNYIQSKFCDLAVNIDKDVSDLFVQLNNQHDYVIAKAFGRQSERFPYYYFYYYSDVDVVVRPSDVKKVSETAEQWLNEKYGGNKYEGWLSIERVLEEDEQIEIQVSLRGWRYFLVHVQTLAHFSIDNSITDEFLAHKELADNKLIYILPSKYDMLIRSADLAIKPQKDWHRIYITKHIKEFDEDLAERSFRNNPDFLRNIKQIIFKIQGSK